MYGYFTKSPLHTYFTVLDQSHVKVSLLVWRTRYTDTFCDAVDCRFELALEVQRWTMGPVANVCRGPKNYIVMPLVSAFKANTRISENVSIVHGNSVRDTPSSRKISFCQKGREWTWSGYRARIFQVVDRNPASNMRFDSLCESIRFVKKSAFRFTSHAAFHATVILSLF